MFSTVDSFRERRGRSLNQSTGGAILSGSKSDVSIFILGASVTDDEDKMVVALLNLAHAMDPKKTYPQRGGFLISLLAMAYENPSLYISTNGNNADVRYVIYPIEREKGEDGNMRFVIKTREKVFEKTTQWYFQGLSEKSIDLLFQKGKGNQPVEDYLTKYGYPACLGGIIIQVWIVLIKAITSQADLKGGFMTRVEAFRQDGVVRSEFLFSYELIDSIGALMRTQQNLVSMMVETLVGMNTKRNDMTALEKNIQIVGTYIKDSGLASFWNTITYGIETKMAALSLSNLRPDIKKIDRLIEIYISKGARAPYMCILRDQAQQEFSPGNYPALWSYAMGVAVVQNKAMQRYVTSRDYLDTGMYELGQLVAKDANSRINGEVCRELGLTDSAQENLLAQLNKISGDDKTFYKPVGGNAVEVSGESADINLESSQDLAQDYDGTYALASDRGGYTRESSSQMTTNFRPRVSAQDEEEEDRLAQEELARRIKEKRNRGETSVKKTQEVETSPGNDESTEQDPTTM